MAIYYWVGGNGTWDGSTKTNWATSSGGAGGFGPPTSADTVNFDSLSGTGTCTTAAGAASAACTLNSATLGLTLGANLSTTGSTFTLTLGTLSLGSFTLTCGVFSSNNSNTRAIAFGTGKISISGNNGTVFTTATITGLTVTGTPVVDFTYNGATGTRTIAMGSLAESSAYSVNITAGTDTVSISSNINSLNFTGFTGTLSVLALTVYGDLTLNSGMTVSATTNAITFAATSGTKKIKSNGVSVDRPFTFNGIGGTFQLQDNITIGTTRTTTLTNGTLDLLASTLSTGIFSSSNSNNRTIAFGTGNITITGNAATIFTTATNTNLIVSGSKTVNFTYSGSTGTRTIQGWSGATNAEAYCFNVNVSAGSDTVSIGNGYYQGNLNFTGFSGTLSNGTQSIYGNVTLSSGMTLTAGANTWTFAATSGTQQITTNAKTLDFPIAFNGLGGTFAFQDALTQGSTRAFTITNGTVQLKAGVTSTVGSFVTSGTNQKYLQSTTSGTQATLSQASGVVSTSYLTIQDIFATGGATWNAFYDSGNIDAGNNTNWIFGETPAYGAEYEYRLRSFTEPRRF